MLNQVFLDQFPTDIRSPLREASKIWDAKSLWEARNVADRS